MMGLMRVPNEIWTRVYGLLDKKDLKAVRLVGGPLGSPVASSLLFTTAYIAARKGVLNTFVALITHPEICNYVKRIVYDSSYIDENLLIVADETNCESTLVRMIHEQEHIRLHDLQPCLEQALHSLSNLKSIYYADMSRVSCLPGDVADASWNFDYSEGPLILRGRSTLKRYVVSFQVQKDGYPDQRQIHGQYGGLAILLDVLSRFPDSYVEEVVVGENKDAAIRGGIPSAFLTTGIEINMIEQMVSAFGPLRKLTLWLSMPFRDSTTVVDPPKDSLRGGLRKVLTSMELLEELTIGSGYGTRALCLIETFSQHIWRKLRILSLHNFTGTVQELGDLMERHANSLRQMTIDYFFSRSGTWDRFATALPVIAPDLDLTFGSVFGSDLTALEQAFPLQGAGADAEDVFVPLIQRSPEHYDPLEAHPTENNRDQILSDEEDRESAEYDSDDSSLSCNAFPLPRQELDTELLSILTPAENKKIARLQKVLRGCSVGDCELALDRYSATHHRARKSLLSKFGSRCLVRDPSSRPVERGAFTSRLALYVLSFSHCGLIDVIFMWYNMLTLDYH